MKNTVTEFILLHDSADIVYALSHPLCFGLSIEDILELHSFVFNAIADSSQKLKG